MISYTCKTAIKATVFLATKLEFGSRSGLKEIADYIEASEHTVGKMLQVLVKADLIKSMKGPTGGFYITKEQTLQPLIQIVAAIDGQTLFQECGLGLSRCSSLHPCPIHDEYKKSRDILEDIYKTRTIADLCEPVNRGKAYLYG